MGKTMKRYFPVFVLPTLLAFAVAFMVPFIMGIYLSFCDFTTVTNAKFVGISNYVKAFTNPDFLKALWFTVKFAVLAVVTINICGFALALMLTQNIKGRNIFRTIFFMQSVLLFLSYTVLRVYSLDKVSMLMEQNCTRLVSFRLKVLGLNLQRILTT